MTTYNTASDAANTAVRAFLTKVGEFYLGRSFNTASGRGKADWLRIRDEVFARKCAYCGEKPDKLQIEHLLMFNRTEYGLHHPGNIVPSCDSCNKRKRNDDRSFATWEEQLAWVCNERNQMTEFEKRFQAIKQSMENEGYPKLNENERHAIRVIASSLYENIKGESVKSLELYKHLDAAFVQNR